MMVMLTFQFVCKCVQNVTHLQDYCLQYNSFCGYLPISTLNPKSKILCKNIFEHDDKQI